MSKISFPEVDEDAKPKESKFNYFKSRLFRVKFIIISVASIAFSIYILFMWSMGKKDASLLLAESERTVISLNKDLEEAKKIAVEKSSKYNELKDSKSLLFISKDTIETHMKDTYDHLSSHMRSLILNEIFTVSKKYDMNPIIYYALIHRESGMRAWMKHADVVVPVVTDNSGTTVPVKTNAIGLGGVIWEIWKTKLIKAGIAETKADLYDPVVNIRALGLILDHYSKQDLLPGVKSKDKSAIIRYYGVLYNKGTNTLNTEYFDKIDYFIGNMVESELYRK